MTKAEEWLDLASTPPRPDRTTTALVGIGHALVEISASLAELVTLLKGQQTQLSLEKKAK